MYRFILAITSLPVILLSKLFAGTKLWNWFISTNFEVKEISMYESFILFFVISFFSGHEAPDNKKLTDGEFTTKVVVEMLSPWLVLGIASVIRLFA